MTGRRPDHVEALKLLAGLTLGQIPIAGSKRRSIAIQLQGQLYRIGRIPANRAFVVIRGNLRLLYVCPHYGNYRYAARKVFGRSSLRLDIDHLLGRELTKSHGFWYTLAARLDPGTNRSHGWLEQPQARPQGINLEKFCYTDERVFQKITGVRSSRLSSGARVRGYRIVTAHPRPLESKDALKVRRALGMGDGPLKPCFLRPIER